jgi:TonB-dependent siderophore receptor
MKKQTQHTNYSRPFDPLWRVSRVFSVFLFVLLGTPCSGIYAEDLTVADDAEKSDRVRFELEEVVVTGTRIEDPVKEVPRNITVITKEDIDQAPSNNIVDLLAREANINPRSFFGNDKSAGVDIRGMGDTFVSNVVVMVDGYRLNPPDLAGPDFSSIPLDQIERIEILRGAGSVVYGDGAVGGVINIITKKGDQEPEARFFSSYGSFDAFESRASYQGKTGRLAFRLNGGYASTDGYRDNGGFRKNDGGVRLGYDITDSLVVEAAASFHRDGYGLPGSVALEDIDSHERRRTTTRPLDGGTTQDSRYTGGFKWDLDDWGVLKAHRGYRFRDNWYIMGFNPLLSPDAQRNHINEDTKLFDLDWVRHVEVFGLEHRIHLGLDHFKTEYVRTELSRNKRENSEVESLGAFAMLRAALSETLHLNLGYRRHRTEGIFRTDQYITFAGERLWENGDPYGRTWSNTAWDAGIVWDITPDHTVFVSYASSFRTPNVDELGLSDDDLHPQEGTHIEIGSRHVFSDFVEFTATLFQIEIEDEIYYDGTDYGLNRNYDDTTLRRGIETDLKLYLLDNLFIWGNWTLMRAEFEEKGTRVPLVPDTKASLGFEWQAFDPLVIALTGTWVGSRFDGSDEDNETYPKLESYSVVDGKITYTHEGWKLFFGANNILDTAYTPIAYSGTYYPAPEQTIYGGFEWKF